MAPFETRQNYCWVVISCQVGCVEEREWDIGGLDQRPLTGSKHTQRFPTVISDQLSRIWFPKLVPSPLQMEQTIQAPPMNHSWYEIHGYPPPDIWEGKISNGE